jgi:hypothetical protein
MMPLKTATLRRFAVIALFAVCHAHLRAQLPYNPAFDQPATPQAAQWFSAATYAECQVLQQYNPAIHNCGIDALYRNPTLQAWGLTQPGPGLQTVTRYSPAPLTQILNTYGATAVFFILAHEAGHHFDLQFQGAAVPWGSIVYPPMPGVPLVFSANWTLELRADAWGGCAVKRTGNSIAPVAALQMITANIENNPDVPPVQYVQLAIQAGYNAC